MNHASEIIKALALKEIELCATQEQLLATRKRWNKYFIAMNKYIAGKGGQPYFDESGDVRVMEQLGDGK